jgi:hypothetical protein
VITTLTKNILQTYLRRLTNLSGNNRSLLLLKMYADQLMDLHEMNLLNGGPSFEVIKALIAGRNIKLCQVVDSRLEINNEVSRKLKKIQRMDHFLFEERGSNDLHVGWPFIRGKFLDGTMVRCPLLFFPVTLVQENNHWFLNSRPQAGITFNKSFLLAYAFYNKIKLDEELIDTNFEDYNVDSTVFRTQLYQLLKEKLEINFNPDNFRDELVRFQEFKKESFDLVTRNGEIKLFPEAVLGIFPQAGSQLVPDYLKLLDPEESANPLEHNSFTDLEEFFAGKNLPPEQLATLMGNDISVKNPSIVKEEKLFTPFSIDSYQESAIRAIKNGQSIVVQGPPGTGKSQLICNLMADAIASGRRVLLVCQKRAALDVVYDRLKSKDLSDFVALVHDFRNERKAIFGKVAKQIDNIDSFKALNRSVDAIQTERRFFQVCRLIDQITENLEHFKKALFDDSECGLSVKELYLTSDLYGESINVRQEYQYFTFTTLPDFLRRLRQYSAYESVFSASDYLWKDRKSFATYSLNDSREIEKVISDIPKYQKQFESEMFDLIGIKLTIDDGETLKAREDDILGMVASLKNDTVYRYFLAMSEETDDETSTLWFTNVERVLMNCFHGAGPEVTLSHDQLGKFHEVLHRCVEARGNLVRRIRWELFSKEKMWIKRILIANNLPYNSQGLETLEEKIDNRLNLEHHLTALKKKSWLIDLPPDYDHSQLKTWFTRKKLAMRAKLIFNSLREVRKAITPNRLKRDDFSTLFKNILTVVSGIGERKQSWAQYLSPFQIRHLILEPAAEKDYLKLLRKDFESLVEFDKLKESLEPHEKAIIEKLHDATKDWNSERLEAILQNSLRLTWIDHIELKYPDLRSVSSRRMMEQQDELVRLVEEKQKLSHDILLLRARERVYEKVEYNRLNNRVTYRDLYHQVTKKKKIWPLRKVITDFQDELFNVMPVWMASPESVSAIFPMKEIFDLVIFDEASQCFAERGIPAMYRGKQLLVAGDEMQLKPNELYQIRWEEDADHPDLEVESLLDLTERYLPTVHLQGHYRSRSLDLIDFSNRHFYEGRLQLLPDRTILNQQEPGIEYCKVDGVWVNNTNPVEAAIIVQRVTEMIQRNPDKEIGIVTFNSPQQTLILDMLEDVFTKSGMKLPETLFVKNIENVQGDEKDIIIFSVGYAHDKKKKLNMQFGSLSMEGGENRLNVAVTRAREKVILVCSIQPEDLRTEDVKNEGPKLLKKYLEFARTVHERKFIPRTSPNIAQKSTWYLNQKIKEWAENKFKDVKFDINTLPLSDISVQHNGQHIGIIRTDDNHYFTGLSGKESFAYVPMLFEQKNWKTLNLFSRNLWQDRDKLEEDLMRFIGSRIAS